MNYIFIINKAAGNGKYQATELEKKINEVAEELGISDKVSCYITTHVGDAVEYTKALKPCGVAHTVIACGGDGTFREVVNGVMKNECRSDISVGILPCGTGNDFVKAFTPDGAFLDINAQLQATSEEIDVIKIDGEYCVNLANMGFDANIANNMQRYKKSFGKLSYNVAVIRELFAKSRFPMTIELDGKETVEGDFILLSIANGMAYGGGYYAAPLSSMKDGILDVCYCDMISKPKLITVIGKYKAGEHFNGKYDSFIHRKTAKSIKIKFGRPTLVSQDGEITERNSLHVSVIPSALKLSIPKGCTFKNNRGVK